MCADKSDSKESETAADRVNASSRLEGTEAIVTGLFRVVSKFPQLGLNDNLIALGIDSQGILELVARLSRTFDRQIPVSAVYEYATARTMTAWLLETQDDRSESSTSPGPGAP